MIMGWIKNTPKLYTEKKLKKFIRKIEKKKLFSFAISSRNKILAFSDKWPEEWNDRFLKILGKIENKEKDYPDEVFKRGRAMPLLINKDYSMVIFFIPPSEAEEKVYCIYDFKIEKNKNIHDYINKTYKNLKSTITIRLN